MNESKLNTMQSLQNDYRKYTLCRRVHTVDSVNTRNSNVDSVYVFDVFSYVSVWPQCHPHFSFVRLCKYEYSEGHIIAIRIFRALSASKEWDQIVLLSARAYVSVLLVCPLIKVTRQVARICRPLSIIIPPDHYRL